MKQKIITRLRALYPGVNLSNARLDAIADKLASKITDENDIDNRINELNDVLSFSDIAKQDDRVRTLEAEKKKPEPPKPADPQTPEPPKPGDDTPAWAKSMIEQNQKLAEKLEALEKGKTQQDNMSALLGLLNEKKIPKEYYELMIEGRSFKDSEEVSAFANRIIESHTAQAQAKTNEGLKTDPPIQGVVKDPAKDVSPMMQEFLAEKKKQEPAKVS